MIYHSYIEIFIISFYILKNLFFFIINQNKFLFIKNITTDISKLNIVYIKIFQNISINSSFFNKNIQNYLVKYTDNVPYQENEIDYDAINYLKQDIEISKLPINSGIFALVYKGKYNQKDVAIKILKKNIKNKLTNSIHNLELIFYIFSFIPYLKHLNLYHFLIQNKENLINQTFFHKESNNLINFKKSIDSNDNIIIPDIYHNFTQDNIIVMDYIHGKKFSQLDKNQYNHYGKLLLNIYITKNGICNYMHSDLHVGNILFLENKICILDFGLIIKIKDEYLTLFFDLLFECIIHKNYDFIYNNFNLFMSKKLDFNTLSINNKLELKQLLNYSTKKVFEQQLDLIYLINQINNIINKYNIFIDTNIIEIAFSYTFIFNTLNELLGKSCLDVFKSEFKNIFKMIEL